MGPSIPDIAVTEDRVRELRADAMRNRERIIAAAMEVFAERGLDASTAEIAHRAGVGEATLFRRFPSKDDLVTAIVESQIDQAIALADECLADPDPGKGLERFLSTMVERSAVDKGALESAKDECIMCEALSSHRRRLLDALAALVKRAQAAGAVRSDITGQDIAMLAQMISSTGEMPFPGLRDDLWKRYLQLVLDGLRPEGATRLRPGPPARRVFENPDT